MIFNSRLNLSNSFFIASVCAFCVLASACTPKTRVILLPQEGGKTGAVEVSPRNKASDIKLIDKAYDAAVIASPSSGFKVEALSQKQVDSEYKNLLDAQPPAAQKFILHFETGTSKLTAESQKTLDKILQVAKAFKGSDIVITGHTDTVGDGARNDELSLQRAELIRGHIIAQNFDPSRVAASGRGERELLVQTPDQTENAENRRAEVILR